MPKTQYLIAFSIAVVIGCMAPSLCAADFKVGSNITEWPAAQAGIEEREISPTIFELLVKADFSKIDFKDRRAVALHRLNSELEGILGLEPTPGKGFLARRLAIREEMQAYVNGRGYISLIGDAKNGVFNFTLNSREAESEYYQKGYRPTPIHAATGVKFGNVTKLPSGALEYGECEKSSATVAWVETTDKEGNAEQHPIAAKGISQQALGFEDIAKAHEHWEELMDPVFLGPKQFWEICEALKAESAQERIAMASLALSAFAPIHYDWFDSPAVFVTYTQFPSKSMWAASQFAKKEDADQMRFVAARLWGRPLPEALEVYERTYYFPEDLKLVKEFIKDKDFPNTASKEFKEKEFSRSAFMAGIAERTKKNLESPDLVGAGLRPSYSGPDHDPIFGYLGLGDAEATLRIATMIMRSDFTPLKNLERKQMRKIESKDLSKAVGQTEKIRRRLATARAKTLDGAGELRIVVPYVAEPEDFDFVGVKWGRKRAPDDAASDSPYVETKPEDAKLIWMEIKNLKGDVKRPVFFQWVQAEGQEFWGYDYTPANRTDLEWIPDQVRHEFFKCWDMKTPTDRVLVALLTRIFPGRTSLVPWWEQETAVIHPRALDYLGTPWELTYFLNHESIEPESQMYHFCYMSEGLEIPKKLPKVVDGCYDLDYTEEHMKQHPNTTPIEKADLEAFRKKYSIAALTKAFQRHYRDAR